MKSPEELTPAIEACLRNAEKLIATDKASAAPGRSWRNVWGNLILRLISDVRDFRIDPLNRRVCIGGQ
jgi:hypothetical protein